MEVIADNKSFPLALLYLLLSFVVICGGGEIEVMDCKTRIKLLTVIYSVVRINTILFA